MATTPAIASNPERVFEALALKKEYDDGAVKALREMAPLR